jgi:hypothetical protein
MTISAENLLKEIQREYQLFMWYYSQKGGHKDEHGDNGN